MSYSRFNRYFLLLFLILALAFATLQGSALTQDRDNAPEGLDYFVYLPTIQRFTPLGIHGYVTDWGAPASNVFLLLRFYNGSEWSTTATSTTDSDGMFKFLNAPGLGPGQVYYVRFPNDNDIQSQLAVWGTAAL